MSFRVLVATEKSFAKPAVAEIVGSVRPAFTLKWVTDYTDAKILKDAVTEFKPHAIVVRSDKITPEVLACASDDLKIIVRAGAGYDNIDVKACNEKKIVVMNTPGQNSNAVAELCFGLMIDLARNHFNGKSGFELRGKTLGLHAFGNVSRYMNKIAKGFGMKVATFDPYISDELCHKEEVHRVASLKDLYATSDYVSIHCPLTPETKGMVNGELLGLMKPNATLINSAREQVVDEEALAHKLEACKAFKYGADVAPKIAKELSEKFKERVLFTAAKMGAQTEEANTNSGVAALREIMDFFEKNDVACRVPESKW
eukprot:TRINITY_DN20248_c0_g1_i1.p1 TRINITY_DN20248_c0_g1~~TRINITY_DN20248_c0_g1_i1.p1  ORF type:complete len:314 (-),score=69.08 TRINITY_DN20248_c0_g1_i1:58-999(-)